MSLFYMTTKIIKKAKQSAVASASYRSGQDLYSERDLEMKSYKEREVQPDSFILAPEHAPEWVYNRETLWNEVESVEKNWNARLSREVLIALPVELPNDVQKELVMDYVNENFVADGMVADISIHRDRMENPHAHIMLTVRPFNDDGSWGNKKKKEYIKDEEGNFVLDQNGKKKYKTIQLTDWDRTESLLTWRENLATKINLYYEKHNVSERVSHESYENQGLDILPKQRLTREEYAIEKAEKERAEKENRTYEPKTYYGKVNKEIEDVNETIKNLKKEIRLKSQKVVSLSDYRETRNDALIDKLNSIRKNIQLSSDDWKSLKLVANRIGGFVDLESSKENIEKLNNWKKKLEQKTRFISAEEKVLAKAKNAYEKDPAKVLLYGFTPSNFKEEFNEKVKSLIQTKKEHESASLAFNDLYIRSQRVYDIQKQFLNEEFNYLYPQYQGEFDDIEEVNSIKSKYVESVRNGGIRPEIVKEFEGESTKKLDEKYLYLKGLVKEWQDVKKSLYILEKTKEKRKSEYKDSYQKLDSKKTYDSSIKFNESLDQVSKFELKKDELIKEVNKEFKILYPNITEEISSQIPTEKQVLLIQLNINEQSTGKLSEDLKSIYDSVSDKRFKDNKEFGDFAVQQQSNDSGVVADSLMDMIKAQETKDFDLEAKRKRKDKPKMLYRGLEREL